MFPRRSELLSYAVIWFWAGFLSLALSDLSWLRTVYGRDPECSTEFSTSLSYKFTKFESLSSDKLSSELLQLSRSAIEFSYGILVAQCLCSTAYVTADGYCFHRKWIFSHQSSFSPLRNRNDQNKCQIRFLRCCLRRIRKTCSFGFTCPFKLER